MNKQNFRWISLILCFAILVCSVGYLAGAFGVTAATATDVPVYSTNLSYTVTVSLTDIMPETATVVSDSDTGISVTKTVVHDSANKNVLDVTLTIKRAGILSGSDYVYPEITGVSILDTISPYMKMVSATDLVTTAEHPTKFIESGNLVATSTYSDIQYPTVSTDDAGVTTIQLSIPKLADIPASTTEGTNDQTIVLKYCLTPEVLNYSSPSDYPVNSTVKTTVDYTTGGREYALEADDYTVGAKVSALSIEKYINNPDFDITTETFNPNDSIDYAIEMTNIGNSTINDLLLTDDMFDNLPDGAGEVAVIIDNSTAIPVTPGAGTDGRLYADILSNADLAAGKSVTVLYMVDVPETSAALQTEFSTDCEVSGLIARLNNSATAKFNSALGDFVTVADKLTVSIDYAPVSSTPSNTSSVTSGTSSLTSSNTSSNTNLNDASSSGTSSVSSGTSSVEGKIDFVDSGDTKGDSMRIMAVVAMILSFITCACLIYSMVTEKKIAEMKKATAKVKSGRK